MCQSPQIFWLPPKNIYFLYLFFPLCFIGSKKLAPSKKGSRIANVFSKRCPWRERPNKAKNAF
jgi:hypothetical protein